MTQFSIFDTPMQKGAGETGRPVDAGDAHTRLRATDGVRRARGSEIPHDVLRIVEHRQGSFIELKRNGNGEPTGRTYRYVETVEHALYVEFSDGERKPGHALLGLQIEDGIANGTWIEVRA